MGGVKLTDAARKLLEETTARYETHLAEVAPYLAGRGFTEEAARSFRLGYVKGDHPSDADYAGRLAVPYVTPAGVVDLRYRALTPDGPKYLSRPGSTTKLFNVKDLLVESPTLYVTEGELDCITAVMCGLPTVGVPGANNWQGHFRLLMADYSRVIVMCDGDEAGRQFGKTVAKEVDTAVPIAMPPGMDVNDLFVAGGKDAVLEMVEL